MISMVYSFGLIFDEIQMNLKLYRIDDDYDDSIE